MVKGIEERRISAALDTNMSDNEQQGEEMAVSLFQSYQRHVATWHKLKRQVNHQGGGGEAVVMRRQRRLLSTLGLTSKEDAPLSFIFGPKIRELLICFVCALLINSLTIPFFLKHFEFLLFLLPPQHCCCCFFFFPSGLWILTEKCGGCVKGMRAGRMPNSS